MSLRQWKSVLELKNKDMADHDRTRIIKDQLKAWSTEKCFYRKGQSKNCSCFSFLDCPVLEGGRINTENRNMQLAIASYILIFAKMERVPQKMLVMEKMKAADG